MAFVTPTDVTVGSVLTASKYNADVVANMNSMGLIHINTTTVSASSFVVNECFTSAFSNYLLIFDYRGSAAATTAMQLRASGSNNGSGYFSAGVVVRYDNGTIAGVNNNNGTRWDARLGHTDTGTSTRCQTTMTLTGPQLSVNTTMTGMFNDARTAAGSAGGQFHGFHNVASAFDGFEFFASSGNLTGTVRVYGYRNS
jgi:hypothetical protein